MSAALLDKPVERRNLVDFLGYRVTVVLDDRSQLVGRLVSLSPCGNLILTDVERKILLKRRRGDDGVPKSRQENYSSVLFVRGSSITSVYLNKNLTTDCNLVDTVADAARNFDAAPRVIEVGSIGPKP